MIDLLDLTVDYVLQDKQEVFTSETARQLFSWYVYDDHNIFRRRYQNLKREKELPESWHKGMTNEPPYVVKLEGESPRPADPLTGMDRKSLS